MRLALVYRETARVSLFRHVHLFVKLADFIRNLGKPRPFEKQKQNKTKNLHNMMSSFLLVHLAMRSELSTRLRYGKRRSQLRQLGNCCPIEDAA